MTGLIPLSNWLLLASDRPVATGDTGMVTRKELEERVAYWYRKLPAEPGQRWAVYHQDAVEFAAILLALWQLECTACIPGDNRPATNIRLGRRVAGFVGQYPESGCLDEKRCSEQASGVDWRSLPVNFPAVEIYTSGSTGEPKPVLKTFEQIEGELAALEKHWPGQEQAVVVTTVTHQHLYGLTFRLFWPLSKGQLFERKACQFTEDLFQRAQQHRQFILVSTPSHLSRLNPALDWDSLRSGCCAVLSSAAPLQRVDSLRISTLLNAPVREIYGSSETGAVAWRIQRQAKEANWQPLPGVRCELTLDKTLRVIAPQVEGGHHVLSDRVELDVDGGFRLQGRTDRIAKIEGKRISLVEVEQVAEQHQLINTARAVVLSHRRTEIALVVQLTHQGMQYLQCQGKQALTQQLREIFKQHFEPVALPRRWRFVEQLPYNQQGKITVEALMVLFQPDELKWPDIVSQTGSEQMAELELKVSAKLVYFDGHFTDNPILPGITQVHWAAHYGRKLLGVDGAFCRLEVAKFQQVIFPEAVVTLKLDYQAEKQKLVFCYFSDKGVHASGRICFN
ncbi:acyl-coenzyme A synthetase/AMP-(fatty) acid ligase [Oceanisphaera litoralis]|uniref:AMP-binding protein n=1 Tax=Oceanisphaera litoralis TaxID=225144 RepID=UPI00195A7ABA|nr:AMP-binding protein [Oceanisphaera litoralis]MBM7456136.1 acyl-coenzyme A synthetase/AMP-(fatty) acid ligase [Oceanisphaera litoralis]